jgi:hypothetical protein
VRISLSGGRVGPVVRPEGRTGFFGGQPIFRTGEQPSQPAAAGGTPPARAPSANAGPPGGDCDYSFIFAIGEYEQIPGEESPLADKYSCSAREQLPDVLDPKAGYVWDSTRQDPGSDAWGRYPRSGRAEVYQYPGCDDGRVVADVVKLYKGHTEGYEPNITDKIMELATSAAGGKIASGAWEPPEPPARRRGFGL